MVLLHERSNGLTMTPGTGGLKRRALLYLVSDRITDSLS